MTWGTGEGGGLGAGETGDQRWAPGEVGNGGGLQGRLGPAAVARGTGGPAAAGRFAAERGGLGKAERGVSLPAEIGRGFAPGRDVRVLTAGVFEASLHRLGRRSRRTGPGPTGGGGWYLVARARAARLHWAWVGTSASRTAWQRRPEMHVRGIRERGMSGQCISYMSGGLSITV